jgi:hypothetical protein
VFHELGAGSFPVVDLGSIAESLGSFTDVVSTGNSLGEMFAVIERINRYNRRAD